MSDNYSLLDELAAFATDDLTVCLEALARTGQPFTYADAVEALPDRTKALLRDPENAKHAGNLMKRLKRAGTIELTGNFVRASHGPAKGHVVAIWTGGPRCRRSGVGG